MHFLRMLERWAGPEPESDHALERRQTTRITALPTNNPISDISSIIESITSAPPATTRETTTARPPTTTNRPQETSKSDDDQQTTAPSSTNRPQETKTSQQTNAPSSQSSNKPATTNKATSNVTNAPANTGTATTNGPETIGDTPTESAKSGGSSGGLEGVKGRDIAIGVGTVAGVVGAFAFIVIGVYIWRRHHRRRQMERIGSMEELPRPPSPGPLSRSFTRGHGPRQPIDDDDDDFLTPMDTLPNTHRMDDYGVSKSPPNNDTAYFDDKSVYAESVYGADEHDHPLPAGFPVAPPAAVTAANGRYYSGDYSNMRPKTPNSPGLGNNNGAIPQYSSMNKYAAYTPGAAVTTPFGASPSPAPSGNAPTPANNRMSMTARPGGGYRSYDSHDAGGYV